MTHVTCRLTAKTRDQLRNPTFSNEVQATFLTDYYARTLILSSSCREYFSIIIASSSLRADSSSHACRACWSQLICDFISSRRCCCLNLVFYTRNTRAVTRSQPTYDAQQTRRLANTLLTDEERARESHVLARNFAKYSPI